MSSNINPSINRNKSWNLGNRRDDPRPGSFKTMADYQAAKAAGLVDDGPVWIEDKLYRSDGVTIVPDSLTINDQYNDRKVLLARDGLAFTGVVANAGEILFAGLLAEMGYKVERINLQRDSTFIKSFENSSNGYEFIVIMRGVASGWTDADNAAAILNGTAVIPTFLLNAREPNSPTNMSLVAGVRIATAPAYKWVTHKAGFKLPVSTYGLDSQPGRINDVEAITTIDNPSGSPVNYPYVFSTAKIRGPKTNVYVEASTLTESNMFPLLLQEAINDGLLRPPRKKLQGGIDVDDMPENVSSMEDLERLYDLQLKYKMPITWGLKLATNIYNLVPQAQYDFVRQRSPNRGGLIYPIEHDGNGYWHTGTAEQIESGYLAALARAAEKNVPMGWDGKDQWGYRYFNTNAVNDQGLHVCAKYNINVARMYHSAKTNNVGWIAPINEVSSKTLFSGVYCVESFQGIASAETNLNLLTNVDRYSLTYRCWMDLVLPRRGVFYLHGSNFYNGHSGGNAPGMVVLEAIGETVKYCKDVMEIVHPSRFLSSMNEEFSYIGAI